MNAYAIGRDPRSWDESEKFKPRRFLSTCLDYKGHHFEYIPFGAGRRGCPGSTFATAVVELALASLPHRFSFALPGGVRKIEDLDVIESTGQSVHRKFPLVVIAIPHHSQSV